MGGLNLAFAIILTLLTSGKISEAQASCSSTIATSYTIPQLINTVFAPIPSEKLLGLHDELAKASNCRLEMLELPLARVQFEFNSGKIQLLLGRIQSKEMDQFGEFILFQTLDYYLITRKEFSNITSLKALKAQKNFNLTFVRGGVIPDEIQSMMGSHKIDESLDAKNLLDKITADRIQGTLIVTPALIFGKSQLEEIKKKFAITKISGIKPASTGAYLSKTSLKEQDRIILKNGIEKLLSKKILSKYYTRFN